MKKHIIWWIVYLVIGMIPFIPLWCIEPLYKSLTQTIYTLPAEIYLKLLVWFLEVCWFLHASKITNWLTNYDLTEHNS